MMKKLLVFTFGILALQVMKAQEDDVTFGVLPTDIPTHNLVRYNRFYFNPTFSLVRENKKSINIYNKIQWAGFNDNPQTYLLNYTANFDEKTGISLGLHQQNEGIYRYFGAVANYAYNLEFSDEVNLTFGLNLGFSQSSIKSNIDAATTTVLNNGLVVNDPVILNFENSSVAVLSPGANFNYGAFDVGVAVNNLVAYNISASELATDNLAFRGHAMYTTSLGRDEDKIVRGIAYANVIQDADLRYGANVIAELPKLGWAQVGYNSFYGASLGLGANITPNVSIGYTYETGLGDTSNFGATHEVGLAYNFAEVKSRRKPLSSKASLQRDSEIRRLKKEILDQNELIKELRRLNGDSLSQAQKSMSELERKIQIAKEEEKKQAGLAELKRTEEVRLLNSEVDQNLAERQAKELASQRILEQEMLEQKAEEERLAALSRLEQENSLQRTEEERIAAEQLDEETRIAQEEEAREAEAARQVEEATRLEERERQTQQAEIEATTLAEQAKQKEELLRSTSDLVKGGTVQSLRTQKRLISESTFISNEEKERLTNEIDEAVVAKEEEATRLVEQEEIRLAEQRQREEAEATRLAEEEIKIQEAEIEAARLAEVEQRQREEAEATRLAEEEIKTQEAEIEAARLAEAETVRQAQEAAQKEELLRSTSDLVRGGTVQSLRSQKRLISESSFISNEEKERLTNEIDEAVAAKEVEDATKVAQEAEAARVAEQARVAQEAEAARVAEEARVAQEAEAARVAAEEARVAQEAEAARVAEEVRVAQEAEAARVAEEARVAQEAEAARVAAEEARVAQEAEAARVAEEARVAQEAETARVAEEARVAQEAEAARVAEEARVAQEAEAARVAEEARVAQEAEAARIAQEAAQKEELLRSTSDLVRGGTVQSLRSQKRLISESSFISNEEKERLTNEIDEAVAAKEAEAARVAAEEARVAQEAEAARVAAEEARVAQEAEAARVAAEEARVAQEAEAARAAEEARVAQEAEAARVAEEARVAQEAEAARAAEEARVAQEAEAARVAEEARQAEATPVAEDESEIQKEIDNSSRITDKLIASRDSLLTSAVDLDKRDFNKVLESLVNMGAEAEEVKNSDDIISSRKLTANNRFVKFAEASRPEAKYATKYIPGYKEGYYLIGNVFQGGSYANSFTSKLNDLGFNDAEIILNPENEYQYVSIQYYADKNEAAENYLNNIGNKYFGDMWILNIAKNRVESLKRLVQETRLIKDTVKDDTVLTENLSYIGGHNIENGYYLIANIFKRENYFERRMEELKSRGLEPKFFRNPKDNYIYIYLDQYDNLDQAKQSLFSNVSGTYDGDLYILKIQ